MVLLVYKASFYVNIKQKISEIKNLVWGKSLNYVYLTSLFELCLCLSLGRGLKNGENFELLYKLADKLNAAGKLIEKYWGDGNILKNIA